MAIAADAERHAIEVRIARVRLAQFAAHRRYGAASFPDGIEPRLRPERSRHAASGLRRAFRIRFVLHVLETAVPFVLFTCEIAERILRRRRSDVLIAVAIRSDESLRALLLAEDDVR